MFPNESPWIRMHQTYVSLVFSSPQTISFPFLRTNLHPFLSAQFSFSVWMFHRTMLLLQRFCVKGQSVCVYLRVYAHASVQSWVIHFSCDYILIWLFFNAKSKNRAYNKVMSAYSYYYISLPIPQRALAFSPESKEMGVFAVGHFSSKRAPLCI